MNKKLKLSNKSYKIWNVIPAVTFTIFAGLVLVFMCTLPVARVDAFGLKEKFGTVLSGTRFGEIVGLDSLSLTLLIVGLVTFVYAVVVLLHKVTSLKYRKVFGKPLFRWLEIVSIAFLVVHLVFAFAIIGKINAADDGLNIIKVGAYPIVTIILTIVSLLIVGLSIVLSISYEKENPELFENWVEERKKLKEEYKTSKGKKIANKAGQKAAKFALLPVMIVAMLLINSTNNPIRTLTQRLEATKTFNASTLKNTLMEDAGSFNINKYNIESKIGNSYVPEGSSEDSENVVYFTENYIELIGKAERNQKYLSFAVEKGDSRISKLLKQSMQLEEEYETLVYGSAEIKYTYNGYLKEVVYNSITNETLHSVPKKLEHVRVFKVYEDYSDSSNTTKTIKKIAYLATYADGSFIYKTCENVSVVVDGENVSIYEGSYIGKTLKWQDQFGSYEVVGTSNSN